MQLELAGRQGSLGCAPTPPHHTVDLSATRRPGWPQTAMAAAWLAPRWGGKVGGHLPTAG